MENKTVNLQSAMYKIYELRNQFSETIKNIKQVNLESNLLIEIVKDSKKSKDLSKDFIKGLEENISKNLEQINTLAQRLSYADKLILDFEKRDDNSKLIDQVVTLVFETLGISSDNIEEEIEKQEGDKDIQLTINPDGTTEIKELN